MLQAAICLARLLFFKKLNVKYISMYKFVSILSVFILINFFNTSTAFAQLDPVKWSFEVEKISSKEYDVIFTADIERGWSVYSQHLDPDQGPIPTSFTFDKTTSIEFIGNTKEAGIKKESFDKNFGVNLVKFSKKARFTQRIKVDHSTKSVKGHLTFMTCDDNSCLPPKDVPFTISLGD